MLGADGKWSNVDSRLAMKMHTVVNAEGELAARADPAWITAFARRGYTLDGAGEIAELAGAVRPVSRRSGQAIARAWSRSGRAAHGGSVPSVEVLQQVDRRAWAVSRPNKPADLDEAS